MAIAINEFSATWRQEVAKGLTELGNGKNGKFSSVADAQASFIRNVVLTVETLGYTTAGDGGGATYKRMSLADITSAGYPSTAYFRSTDRYMPDGTTDATNGGYWVIVETRFTPRMFGAVADGTDEYTEIAAAITVAKIIGDAEVDLEGGSYGSGTALVITGASGLSFGNGKITATGSITSGDFLLKLGNGGTYSDTYQCRIHDLSLDGNHQTDGLEVRDTYACLVDNVRAVHMDAYGIRCRDSQNPETRLVSCDGRKYDFGDSGFDTWSNRAGTRGISIEGADIILDNCTGAYSEFPLYIDDSVGGFLVNGGHFYNGAAAPPSSTITNIVDNGSGLMRVTDTGHGYSTGNRIVIAAVNGAIQANNTWYITVIDANTYDLDNSTFSSAWSSSPNANSKLFANEPASVYVGTSCAGIFSGTEFDNGKLLTESTIGVLGCFFVRGGTGYNGCCIEYDTATASDTVAGLLISGNFSTSSVDRFTRFSAQTGGSISTPILAVIKNNAKSGTGAIAAFGQTVINKGSASLPGLVMSGVTDDRRIDQNTGWYQTTDGEWIWASNGSGKYKFTANDITPITTNSESLGSASNYFYSQYLNRMYLLDAVTAPASGPSGFATIFIDSADGDLKIRFKDGTTKTIVTDT